MDRQFAYAGAIPQNTDVLSTNKNVLYGLGHIIQAALGTGTSVVGLVGAQSTIPDLHISIGPGAIYSSQTVDATAYGDLGTDANTVMKQGILKAAQTLTLTPPGTSGYSQVYLVEATYSDTDGGATVLPYYNSSNPSAPYAGPANAGTSNFTVRQGLCTIALKAGTAAPTGSQVTPSTDAGYVPLYTITLVNGQTAITTAQIILAVGAPFVIYNLTNVPARAIAKYATAGTFSWTCPIGVYKARVTVTGGGAGGAGSNASVGGGNGGAGGTAIDVVSVTPGTVYTIIVGAAGAAAAAGANSGGVGGSSSALGLSATGGSGGVNNGSTGPGGAGGLGSGGTLNLAGGWGSDGSGSSSAVGFGGVGGASIWGGGGRGVASPGSPGITATVPGAGGGGAYGPYTNAGGAGAPGIVVLEY